VSLVVRSDADGVATLVLNRPDKRNALNVELFQALEAHLDHLDRSPESVGVVVLRGAGGCFSAGADVSKPTRAPRRHYQASVIEQLANLAQPVIAAVEGFCIAGGLELALACDLIVAADTAQFADTHSRFGLSAAWGLTQRLPRRIGAYRAREMMFTSRSYSGVEAAAMGLANFCVPVAELDDTVRSLAAEIAVNSWFSHREHKKLLLATDGASLPDGLAVEAYRGGKAAPDFSARIAGRFGHPS
jgi:enoyl-CoA hydratase